MQLRRILQTSGVALLLVIFYPAATQAQPIARSTAEIFRQTSELGLRSPRPLDVRRFEGANLASLRRPPSIDEASLLRFIRQSDVDLARAVEAADPAMRRATLEALAGARAIERAIPSNPVRRAEIVERGGVDLLRAAAHPVEGLGDALLLLDGSMRSGRLPETAMAQFGRALDRHGEIFSRVWRDNIVPNWEVVVAGGLVAALLIDPDRFIDAAGRLTSHAAAAFSDLGVEIVTRVVGGVGQGIVRSISRRIEAGEGWILLVTGMAIISVPLGKFIYRRRIRRLNEKGLSR